MVASFIGSKDILAAYSAVQPNIITNKHTTILNFTELLARIDIKILYKRFATAQAAEE
jgi:hypothetical protein